MLIKNNANAINMHNTHKKSQIGLTHWRENLI